MSDPSSDAPLAERRSRFLGAIDGVEIRDSGAGDGSYTVKGHAAVFNQLSLPLGGFREQIAPGAFTRALSDSPDVMAVWDHDTRYTLARTANNTLELTEDDDGLAFWARVAPTSYASDLRVLMERGDISQCSFAFTIENETWDTGDEEGAELPVATVREIGQLFDVTICAQGAYPQTDVSLASRAARLDTALREGRVPGLTLEDARARGVLLEDPSAGNGEEPAAAEGPDGDEVSERDALLRRLRSSAYAALGIARANTPME